MSYTSVSNKIENSYIHHLDMLGSDTIEHSYVGSTGILSDMYSSGIITFTKSYIINTAGSEYSNNLGYILDNCYFINKNDISGAISLQATNSVINTQYPYSMRGVITNSDYDFKSSNTTTNLFFDGSFLSLENNSSIFYDSLGSPSDTTGDGVAETKFTLDGATYTVDGIVNPRSTSNFPNWVNDPSVKQYFWDPTNVGCLWDSSNPDTFPTP